MTIAQILSILAIVIDSLDDAVAGEIKKDRICGSLDILELLKNRLELQTGGVAHV